LHLVKAVVLKNFRSSRFLASVLLMLGSALHGQNVRLKYFHVNGNVFSMPDNNAVVRFTNSYNAALPIASADRKLIATPGITGTLLAGFSYNGRRNLWTLPIFFGQSSISSEGTSVVQSINFSTIGLGIGYMGFLFNKTFGNEHRFPKLSYHAGLHAEAESFVYKEASKADKRSYFTPSFSGFLQYNLYPPAEDTDRRVGFGLNLQYHVTLTQPDISFLKNDFAYDYTGSLKRNVVTVSAGLSIIFLSSLPDKKKLQNTKVVRFEIVDDASLHVIQGNISVRDARTEKKILLAHGAYYLKKTNGSLPTLEVKARANGFFAKTEIITPTESDIGLYKISLKRIHAEKSLAIIYFHHATSKMIDSAATTIDRVAKILIANPGLNVIIKGHTSSEGSARKNVKLSRERARIVETLLVNRGIANHRIQTEGLGAADRVFPEDSEEHRAYNRRAELFIIQ